jgi:nicotinic acid mononucleotide adenylyltransferase
MIERATQNIEAADHDYHFSAQLARQCTIADVLAKAEKHYGADHEYWFLVGSDIFEHMHQWHDVLHDEAVRWIRGVTARRARSAVARRQKTAYSKVFGNGG